MDRCDPWRSAPGEQTTPGAITIIEAEVHAGPARTRYLRAGAGATLLLLHGAGERPEGWLSWIAPLAAHFRVLAPDLAGGGSPPFDPADATAGCVWLRDFLDGLGVESVHIVARAEGAAVAARFAAAYPERVGEVVWVKLGGPDLAPTPLPSTRVEP
jgi:pimeloyl-ACP methyl ester carboxylesterase